jgi:hypothetical protein
MFIYLAFILSAISLQAAEETELNPKLNAYEFSHGNLFNPESVETVNGEVTQIKRKGAVVVLKTDKGDLLVRFGPPWFLKKIGFAVQQGDKIEVTGSKTTHKGKPLIIALTVKKEGKTTELRNKDGVPVWKNNP